MTPVGNTTPQALLRERALTEKLAEALRACVARLQFLDSPDSDSGYWLTIGQEALGHYANQRRVRE
jgi:hypothetical protein